MEFHCIMSEFRSLQLSAKWLKSHTYKQPHGTTCNYWNSRTMNVPSLFSILQHGQWVAYNTAPWGITSGARFDPPGLCPLAKRIIALQIASFVKLTTSPYQWDFEMTLLIRARPILRGVPIAFFHRSGLGPDRLETGRNWILDLSAFTPQFNLEILQRFSGLTKNITLRFSGFSIGYSIHVSVLIILWFNSLKTHFPG